MSKVKSPCKLICKYQGELCIGCFRTLKEIENWGRYSDQEKNNVLETIKKRKSPQSYYGDPF